MTPPELTTSEIAALRSRAQTLQPNLRIGKQGVTEDFIQSTTTELDRHELIKVRLLDKAADRHAVAKELSQQTGGVLIAVIGSVIVLYRKRRETKKTSE